MKYIIMCGGEYSYYDTPRQLARIHGETLVERTIRLLKENGVKDIYISAQDPCFEEFGVPVLHHDNPYRTGVNPSGSWVQGFYPTDEPACYIMGDVAFSPQAIRTIVDTEVKSIMFFASAPPFSVQFIKKYAEPFAFKVVDQKRFRAAISFVIANENTGIFKRRPISWELWQVINGEAVKKINYENYIAINDYTCDVDSSEDLARIESFIL